MPPAAYRGNPSTGKVILMDSEKIAQTLVELRGARPRAEVATALGVSVSALAMYETGARIPRDETKRKIAQYYEKTVEEIFYA